MKWLIALAAIWLVWRYLRPAPKRVTGDAAAARAAARRTLGVAPAADDDAIRAAHRRLIADAHPDRGGSAEQTRRINAARDLLLKRS